MEASQILRKSQLRVTPHRCTILNYFIQCDRAFTPSDLETVFKDEIDRVSIYRNLNSLSTFNILCKLVDSRSITSYVFDKHSGCGDTKNHPQFICKSCHTVIELPELPQTYIQHLTSLKIDGFNILAEGKCKECVKKELIGLEMR